MATQQSATVQITNNTGQNAWILLYHNNSSNGTQSGSWSATPGETVGPMTVLFETGWGTGGIEDYWSVLVQVQGTGDTAGFYVSSGSTFDPYWKECQLQDPDAGKTLTFTVSCSTFDINLDSGGCSNGMQMLAPGGQITNVFVVMLENHSFDNMLAMSGISGITAATTSDCNSYVTSSGTTTCCVQTSAPLTMPTDPGHELPDVVEQLCGQNGPTYPDNATTNLYPPINNSGFVANYATSTTEGPAPPAADIGDIMECFATPTQLPVLYQLATSYAVCDQWFSSMPGPTWPNRFFVHGASSSGLDATPTTTQEVTWETPGDGFEYPNGSIYMALSNANIPYRFYHDSNSAGLSLYSDDPSNGTAIGAVPQVTALSGVSILDFHSLSDFASDLQGPYPYPYTFIEPHYGDVTSTYEGGSSQHPMDDVAGGEALLSAVYSAIQSSPYWNTSLLIVLYDEHGGFYDCVAPGAATAPGDNPQYGYSVYNFNFEQYGVRVPAVAISPLISAQVDSTVYDHSSVLATIEQLWGLNALTQRDANAASLVPLLTTTTPRARLPNDACDAEAAESAEAAEDGCGARGDRCPAAAATRQSDRRADESEESGARAVGGKSGGSRRRQRAIRSHPNPRRRTRLRRHGDGESAHRARAASDWAPQVRRRRCVTRNAAPRSDAAPPLCARGSSRRTRPRRRRRRRRRTSRSARSRSPSR